MTTSCIEFEGCRDPGGYGRIHRGELAHRAAWAAVHGPIPKGAHVLHSCDNPPCINVEHLSLGTHTENVRQMHARGRSWQSKRTHCPKGHPYEGANLVVQGTSRRCKTCSNARSLAGYYARKAKKNGCKSTPAVCL